MGKLIFYLVLALTAWIISLVTGRNRRQVAKIPEGMAILCQPPEKRYLLYATGVVQLAVVLFFGVLYLLDGAPESTRPMWVLCLATSVGLLAITILGGNLLARDCVYFNGEELQVCRRFRSAQTYRWTDIRRLSGSFDRAVTLYLLDDTKVLTADLGMVNYKPFCAVLKARCPQITADHYRAKTYDRPQKCVLRYGGEYYLLAGIGLLILGIFLALFANMDRAELLDTMLHCPPSQRFSVWFPPVCGVVSLVGLFILCTTSVRYSPEKLVLRLPLRGTREIFWWEIQRIELVPAKRPTGKGWKTLRLYTSTGTCRLPLQHLSSGRDGFLTELFRRAEQYGIACQSIEK